MGFLSRLTLMRGAVACESKRDGPTFSVSSFNHSNVFNFYCSVYAPVHSLRLTYVASDGL